MNRLYLLAWLFVSVCVPALADDGFSMPDRRRPQFEKDPGHYIFPMPYSLPGVGSGVAVIGAAMNIGGSNADVLGFALTGDMLGGGLVAKDIHILPERLVLDVTAEHFTRATVTSYAQRGMNSGKNDFSYLDLGNMTVFGNRLTGTFLDRRVEVYGGNYSFAAQIERVRDSNRNVVLDVADPQMNRRSVTVFGGRFDLTDDYADPRRGGRLEISRWYSPPKDSGDPDFYFTEYNASFYVPMGQRSTLAFNYFRSDAHVTRPGATDPAVVAQSLGLDCASAADPVKCQQIVDNTIAANTHGTVGTFGGTSRLRSYPHDRYTGAHAVFYGSEFRWNLTEERVPFDLYIMKDIRTIWQLAFFYETGSVADNTHELGDIWRSSYGIGIRMVTASGLVFRADVATGNEGVQTSIIVGYAWEAL